MIDIKALAAEYDCRREVEDVLGCPRLRTAKSWAWCCPFHNEDSPSFHVYETHYYCYGCEARGDVLDWWSWSRNVPLAEIIRQNTVAPMTPEERQRIATRQAEQAARELEEKIKEAQKALEELKKAQSWIRYHNNLTCETRALWRARGISDDWQNYWKLGYSPACPTFHKSPSLTIPIFTPNEKDPINIRHRLLCPETPGDKYRPEKPGLPAVPFYGDPELPVERAEQIIVVEGEIKAAVTFLTLDTPLVQVIGLPGKKSWKPVAESLKGQKNIFIMLDPDAQEESLEMAHEVGGAKVIRYFMVLFLQKFTQIGIDLDSIFPFESFKQALDLREKAQAAGLPVSYHPSGGETARAYTPVVHTILVLATPEQARELVK